MWEPESVKVGLYHLRTCQEAQRVQLRSRISVDLPDVQYVMASFPTRALSITSTHTGWGVDSACVHLEHVRVFLQALSIGP